MRTKLLTGVYAAVITPRSADGDLDLPGLARIGAFLARQRIDGLAINGATGEFCLTTAPELDAILQTIIDSAGAAVQRVCGIGSPSVKTCLALARVAARSGASSVLLPPPYLFRYQQDDLVAFVRAVADESPLPVLLYNLPQFCTPYEKETVMQLVSGHPNIAGIKDSSGTLTILSALRDSAADCCRILGNDSALPFAVRSRVCDAVISGMACVVPELITSVFGDADNFERLCNRLDQVVEQVDLFPAPWGVKWLASARGLAAAEFALPVSQVRKQQADRLLAWFREWWPAVESECA